MASATTKKKKKAVSVSIAVARAIALSLPETQERPSYGTPGFFVRKKLFARVLDADTIVVRVDLTLRDALVMSSPRVFSVTPHYENHPWVVISLSAISRARLKEAMTEAWRLRAPAKLVISALGS